MGNKPLGSSTVNIAPFDALGVYSYKPAVGRGNGGSHGYAWFYGNAGFAAHGNFEWDQLTQVLHRLKEYSYGTLEEGLLTKRHRFLIATLGLQARFTECNVMRIRDRADNPRSKNHYYTFLRTKEDAILFRIMLESVKLQDDISFFGFFSRALRD